LPPINEFARLYQSKNKGIYAVCENGELSSLFSKVSQGSPLRRCRAPVRRYIPSHGF
jgi:hypothetical protein